MKKNIFTKKSNIENIEEIASFLCEYDIILKNEETILRHVDLYRLSSEDELNNIGFKDKIKERGITMIEWGDKFESYFDKPYYELEIEMIKNEENSRLYRINLIQ